VAIALADADQRGHERLIHRFRNQINEQVGNQKSGEEGVHRIRAAVDSGNGELLEGGDDLDQNAGSRDRQGRAQNAPVDAAALKVPRELGDWTHDYQLIRQSTGSAPKL
jgi:hypothetical protein